MSHFSVLVIGENVAEQLQPYHEFECTGTNDQYIQDIDITADRRKEWEEDDSENKEPFADWCASYHNDTLVPFGQPPDKDGEHKYGFVEVDAAGEVVRVIDRTNPNAKWDYWRAGGRWSDFLTPQTHEEVRQTLLKREFLYQDKCTNLVHEGLSRWHKSQCVIASTVRHMPWKEMLKIMDGTPVDEIRTRYHEQERVKVWGKSVSCDSEGYVHDADDTLLDPREYASQFMHKNATTFAYVINGEWFERGEMGWWACVSNEKDQKTWAQQWGEMFASLPDDTVLTLVDCHI